MSTNFLSVSFVIFYDIVMIESFLSFIRNSFLDDNLKAKCNTQVEILFMRDVLV